MTELTAPWVEPDRPVVLIETGVRIVVDGTPERWP
jgi:hypothetical protein